MKARTLLKSSHNTLLKRFEIVASFVDDSENLLQKLVVHRVTPLEPVADPAGLERRCDTLFEGLRIELCFLR